MNNLSVLLVYFLMGCVGIPENVKPVDNFKVEKYLGKWYEIARLDHLFERGLTRITAEYSFISNNILLMGIIYESVITGSSWQPPSTV
ncbi:MAG: lipocalin family protein [Candidatus Scalinduaceae bacterium]